MLEKSNVRKAILVIGATGQLGSDIVCELKNRDIPYVALGSRVLDITNNEEVEKYFETREFGAVIDAAAFTQVDLAEEEEKEKNYIVNYEGTKNIVSVCEKKDIPLMYFSTDYVFGGEGDKPYKEDDETNPKCEYAKAKLMGELEVKKLKKYFILRISWVFGKSGHNFVKTMLKLALTNKEINVVSDQVGSPTYTVDVANVVVDMINTDKYGVYHVTNDGYVSWADFARLIFKSVGKDVIVHDISSEEYAAKAERPKNSRLDKAKLRQMGFGLMPRYENALERFLKEIQVIQ